MSPYIFGGLVSVAFCMVLLLITKYIDSKKRLEAIKNFPSYATVLAYHMEKAYDIIHKDRILVYSLEATRVSDDQFVHITKEFINLTFKLMGPKLIQEFTYVYGDIDTLMFNLTEYFNTKYEDDEIRKDAIAALVESEISTEEEPKE